MILKLNYDREPRDNLNLEIIFNPEIILNLALILHLEIPGT